MSFLRKVARDFSRDIQVIIKEATGGSSKPKRQRYDPAKAKKRKKGKFKGKFIPRVQFLAKMKAKYGDKAETLNTETQRDFADELRNLSIQALGRLLNRAYRNGDDTKAHAIEREIDRRTKGAWLSRHSRRR